VVVDINNHNTGRGNTMAAGRPLARNSKSVVANEAAMKPTSARLAEVPDIGQAKSYIHRQFPGGWEDFDLFDHAMAKRRNVLIEGPTGPGKTKAVRAYAAAKSKSFYRVSSSIGLEPSQLFGKYIPNPSGGFVWQDGPVTDLVRHGGVLLLNEVNFIPERVGTVLFSLLDEGREIQLVDHRAEVIRAHQGNHCWCRAKDCSDKMLLIVADMNPDYEGTRPLNKAFRNRFAIQLVWDYDPEVEKKLIKTKTIRLVMAQLRQQADTFDTPVSTNMGMEFEETAKELGVEFAMLNFTSHFAGPERPVIKTVLDTHRAGFMADFPEDDDEDENEEFVHDPELEKRLAGKLTHRGDPVYDPDEGVYGDHWLYKDEQYDPDTDEIVNVNTNKRHKAEVF
jgi:hypothetical protein